MVMKRFPEDWELIGLFECEPVVEEPYDPWSYNSLQFVSLREPDRIHCVIHSHDERVEFMLWTGQRCVVSMNLLEVSEVIVHLGQGKDAMELRFAEPTVMPMFIRLKPQVSIEWGMNRHCY